MQSTWSPDLYIKVYRFVAIAHHGQIIPGSDLPYILHINLVAMEVTATLTRDPGLDGDFAVSCALLHDTLEDTDTTYNQLSETFGPRVSDGVAALSKDPSIGADIEEKWIRKGLQMADSLERIKKQPREIWVVKMADRITNLQPPPFHWTHDKIARYRQEALEIYNALKGASPYLSARLKRKIEGYP